MRRFGAADAQSFGRHRHILRPTLAHNDVGGMGLRNNNHSSHRYIL